MRRYLLTGFLLLVIAADSQDRGSNKYKNEVFPDVTIQKDLSYSPGKHPGTKEKFYRLDMYAPTGDTTQLRPLIIWLHGGGFTFGSKKAPGIQLWSETFARRGYVCAALNYRLGGTKALFNFTALKKGCYDAVTDVQEAVAWFKKNHTQFGIDTNRIILAGNSAGGMIALQAVYSSQAELAADARIPGAELLPVTPNPAGVAAVINLWGGLFDISWLKNAHVPIFNVYGDQDKIVPFDHKDTSLYGGYAIHQRARSLGIPSGLKVYEGYSHELQKHFNPIFTPGAATQQRWLEAGQLAADFLSEHLFR